MRLSFPPVQPFGSRCCVREAVPLIDDGSTAGEQVMRTRKFGRNMRRAGGAMLGITLAVGTAASTATAGTVFTWNPAGASPSLGGAFTADTIEGTHNLYDVAR